MFLKYVKFRKLSFRSNASRHINWFFNYITLQKKIKRLSLRKAWFAGKGTNGRTILWTRSALKKKLRTPVINRDLRYNKFAVIASFQFIPFSNKLVTLLYFANGAITYYATSETFILFEYFYWNKKKKIRKFYSKIFWAILLTLKKLIFLNFIELIPGKGAQYSLSAGSKSKLFTIDKKNKNSLIQLPSKVKKLFSYYSVALLGQSALADKKRYLNTKSGYWRNFGRKSIVRGVAMNPVDHPHGGRSKAVRYQRTPWGKTTKKK